MKTIKGTSSKTLDLFIWIAQFIVATCLIWAGSMKLFQSPAALAQLWPWTADHRHLVIITGILDLLAGAGLILPSLLRIRTKLTVYAAYGVILMMIAAMVFHIRRQETSQTGINIFMMLVAVFIAWGKDKK